MKTARPYRSHKYPACTRCHKRRSRCTIEVPGQACLLCRMHGVPCSSATARPEGNATPKVGFVQRSLITDPNSLDQLSHDQLSHIVGPIIARDTQILDKLLPANNTSNGHMRVDDGSNKPIYHALVPPRRPSPFEEISSRNMPLELLDQVQPYIDSLTAMFYEHVHPCFPITDEECVRQKVKERVLPQVFIVNFIAHALFYWDLSPALAQHPRPSQDFAWQVAVSANQLEFQRSDLSIILACTYNVAGRPSKSVVSNTLNVSRIIALSHAIGLNHDCSDWKMSDLERRVRWMLWWGVLIHDRWFHFAQGTPPLINKSHYDVPVPTLQLLTLYRPRSTKNTRASECYIHLCKLTEIVGDVLPLIYHIRSGNDSLAAEQTSRSEIELNRWLENKPDWLNLHDFETRPDVPGLPNLQLSYLAVRMLLRRIAWHEISQRETDPHSSWLEGCQTAAEDIARFVTTLTAMDLKAFWLPYNAHHFSSAVILLLRCALQTTQPETRKQCMVSARLLVDTLKRQKTQDNWDMAEIALPQSEQILQRIETASPVSPVARHQQVQAQPNYSDSNVNMGYVDERWASESSASLQQDQNFAWQGQNQGTIEELFPEIFSDFQDTALFDGPQWRG